MTEIDELEGKELAEAVALAQGWARGFGGYLCGPLDAEGCREIYLDDYRPDLNIAQAWELDGEGWRWDTKEDPAGRLTVRVDDGMEEYRYIGSTVVLRDFATKAQAYATARCRAFLKAKAAE